jgi:hypothetical protein
VAVEIPVVGQIDPVVMLVQILGVEEVVAVTIMTIIMAEMAVLELS